MLLRVGRQSHACAKFRERKIVHSEISVLSAFGGLVEHVLCNSLINDSHTEVPLCKTFVVATLLAKIVRFYIVKQFFTSCSDCDFQYRYCRGLDRP